MGALGNVYIKEEILETLLKTIRAKKEKGLSITFSIDDKTNQFGQNVSAFATQTKEQREAKAKKYYIGNGSIVWTDGTIKVAEKVDKNQQQSAPAVMGEENELPF
jgi:type IV secretory pathway VirB9-like protein